MPDLLVERVREVSHGRTLIAAAVLQPQQGGVRVGASCPPRPATTRPPRPSASRWPARCVLLRSRHDAAAARTRRAPRRGSTWASWTTPRFAGRPTGTPTSTARAAEGSTVIRTIVNWWATPRPRRPRLAAGAFAPEYRLSNVDELVGTRSSAGSRCCSRSGGRPTGPTGARSRNVASGARSRPARDFAHALAARYSGRNKGYPLVRYFSVWNEPNSALFLEPQFDGDGRPVAPRAYAALVATA